ncbi:hypothetical protein [Sulfobacillus thermosulfidooxidans]|uniref:hypothetical protein n=1 Tax=Sulfobacillus thermosulfidooxidans TaxID=28034 RepID=UPI0006B64C7F|nr:hypothetical protein [Sulfobacillus thermosulfidooxidans]
MTKRLLPLFSVVALSSLGLAFNPSAQAATHPSLTLSTQGSNTVGGTVTLTAHQSTSLWDDWWVQEPNGQWKQMTSGINDTTFVMPNLSAGSYLVVLQTLTPSQYAARDWSAARAVQQTVNVDTSVTVTQMTDNNPPSGQGTAYPAAGHSETIVAQATNITNPVYQFWIEENGHWTGTNYTANNTYTFTPTTSHFKVAVYAKTVAEPTNAGSGMGTTPSTATTPQLFNTAEAVQDAKTTLIGVIRKPSLDNATFNPLPINNNGMMPLSFFTGMPSASVIDPLIPSNLPPNGSITGTQTFLKANPSLLSQAQAIVAPQGYTITNQTLIAGMKMAAQAVLDLNSNDPMTLLNIAEPSGLPVGETFEQPLPPIMQTVLNAYTNSNYSIGSDHLYTYDESATIQANTEGSSVKVTAPTTSNSAYYPTRLLDMIVPVIVNQVVYYQSHSSSGIVVDQPINCDVLVGLYHDPFVPGGLQWGYQDAIWKSGNYQTLWPTT